MSPTPPAPAPRALVERLAEQLRAWQRAGRASQPALSTGCPALDRLLPEGALRRGTLVEWLAPDRASGAASLALLVAREACREGGALVVVDRRRTFYPLALAPWGLDLSRLLLVGPRNREDELWALDQALRSPAVGAVLAWPGSWGDAAFRRLQLAAESSGALGLLVREERARGEPSWAEVRWGVTPRPLPSAAGGRGAGRGGTRRLRVELLRCRGGAAGGKVELELAEYPTVILREAEQHETGPGGVAAALAAATAGRGAAGA